MAITKIRGLQVNNATLNTSHLIAQAGITDAQIANANTYLRANGTIIITANQSANGHTWTNLGVPISANDAARLTDIGGAIVANSGIVANASGVFVNANTGIVANISGVFVNAAYINTIAANSATYIVANTGLVSNASGVFVNNGIFVMNEVPTGDYDAVNTVVQLASVPVVNSVMLFLNGLLQDPTGNDYSIVEATRLITFADANTPNATDKVRCSYVKA